MALSPVVLDLSHHNDVRSWADIKAGGIKGVILKCTQGTKYVDPTYAQRKADARAAGLLVGAYAFATNADPQAQVDWFLEHAQVDADLLLALDWENNPDGPDMAPAQARQFLEYLGLKTQREKRYLVIYGGNVLKERITSGDDIMFFADYPLWLCEYGPKAKCPAPWVKTGYWLWQYSESGTGIAGIHDGQVDLNVHGGKDLQTEWAPGAPPFVPARQAIAQAVSSRADTTSADEAEAVPEPNTSPVKHVATHPITWGLAGLVAMWQHAVSGVTGYLHDTFGQTSLGQIVSSTQETLNPARDLLGILHACSPQIELWLGIVCVALVLFHVALRRKA